MNSKEKKTNYRTWKKGKIWVYAASVLLLTGASLTSSLLPFEKALVAKAATVTENGASLTVPDSAVSLFVGESLTPKQFGVSASGSGVDSSSLILNGLNPDSVGSQTASVSVLYSYQKTVTTPEQLLAPTDSSGYNYNSSGSLQNGSGTDLAPGDFANGQAGVHVNETSTLSAKSGYTVKNIKAFSFVTWKKGGLNDVTLNHDAYVAAKQTIMTEALKLADSASQIAYYKTNLEQWLSSNGWTYVDSPVTDGLISSPVATMDTPAADPNGSVTVIAGNAPFWDTYKNAYDTQVPVSGSLSSSFPVSYFARPTLSIAPDITMFASDSLAAKDIFGNVTDSLAAIDNGTLTSSLVSSSTVSSSTSSGTSAASSSSTSSGTSSVSSTTASSSSTGSSTSSSATGSTVTLPTGSTQSAANSDGAELKYHATSSSSSNASSSSPASSSGSGVVDSLSNAVYSAATGEAHVSSPVNQLTAPGDYTIGYDYTYTDPVLGTKHTLHKEQKVHVVPDPVLTAPADIKLMRTDQLVKEDATVKDEGSSFDQGKITADYSKVDTSTIGTYPVTYTYTYHDPYTDTDKTVTTTQHVEIVNTPILNVKPAVTLYVGDKFDINEDRYQYILSDVMKDHDQGKMLDPVVNVDTSKVGSYTITWSYKYVNEEGSWQTISGTQDVYVIPKPIKASVQYTDGSNDLTPKTPIPVPTGNVGDDYKILAAPAIDGYDFVKVTFNGKEVKAGDTVKLVEDNKLVYTYKKIEVTPTPTSSAPTATVKAQVLPHTGDEATVGVTIAGLVALVTATVVGWFKHKKKL